MQTLLRLFLPLILFFSWGYTFSQDSISLGFERVEGFEWGMINVSNDEFISENSKINDTEVVSGKQALLLGNSSEAGSFVLDYITLSGSTIVYVDFYLNVLGSDSGSESFSLVTSPFQMNCSCLAEATGPSAILSFPSAEDSVGLQSISNAGVWNRFTVRLDMTGKSVDLYINGIIAYRDEEFPEQTLGEDVPWLKIDTMKGISIALDDLNIATKHPLFDDSDNDGISDRYETENGMDATMNDRYGDIDGDGVLNIDEYIRGSHPAYADNPEVTDHDFWYVDTDSGSDRNDGKTLFPCYFGNGPLKTIQAGLRLARTGDTLIILPGKEPYHLNTFDIAGKQVRIVPFGKIEVDSKAD